MSGLYPFDNYDCGTYNQSRHREQPECTSHYINTHVLRALSLDAIRLASKYAIANQDEFMRKVREASSVRQAEAAKELKRKLGKAERRVKELDTLLKKLYEDVCCKGEFQTP